MKMLGNLGVVFIFACAAFAGFFPVASRAAPGDTDSTFSLPALDGSIYATAVQPDGKIVMAGAFTGGITRLESDGTTDPSFKPFAFDSSVLSVLIQPDGKIVVGGYFTGNLTRLHPDGTVDSTFTGPALDGNVRAIVLQPDGKLIIGGKFDGMIMRLHANGPADSTFTAPTFQTGVFPPMPAETMYSIALQPDGKMIVAGDFVGFVKRLWPHGPIDGTFTSPAISSYVNCAVVQPDGKILIGGAFIGEIARLYSDGTYDVSFDPPYVYAGVSSIALQADGKVLFYLSGDRIYRLHPNGSADSSFATTANGPVVLQADGKILVGGTRLQNDPATGSLTFSSLDQILWFRGGAAPEATRVSFESSSDGGYTWSELGSGTRIVGGWQITGINLPAYTKVRARAFTVGGYQSSSSGIVEAVESPIWTQYYDAAYGYYAYFASIGDFGSALGWWYYYRAYGDYEYYMAAGFPGYANLKLYEGLGWFYYSYHDYSAPNLAAYYLYHYFAYAYYYYYLDAGDAAGANSYYDYYCALALASL